MTSTLATADDLRGVGPDRLFASLFLARYREPTRSHYAMVVRQWFAWCELHGIPVLEAKRHHVELWMRELEEVKGLKLSTISGKVTCLKMLYKTAVMDDLLLSNPVEWVKRPPVPRQSTTNGLTRTELWNLVAKAKESSAQDEAIITILGYNGLRVGELTAIQVEDVGTKDGYNTIRIVREKSMQPATIPLSQPTSFAVRKCTHGRISGPLFMLRGELPMDRRGVDRIVKRLAKAAGITKRVSPHSLRHTFITLALNAGVPVRDVQNSVGHADARMVSYYDREKESLTRNATHLVTAWVESA